MPQPIQHSLGCLLGKLSLPEKFLQIDVPYSRMVFNLLIHSRLCKGRFIPFIMTMLTIADQIDDDIFSKLLPVIECHVHHMYSSFGIISIYMKNRSQNHFSRSEEHTRLNSSHVAIS